MGNIVDFILAGQSEFTPEVLIRYMIFVLILCCIGNIASSITGVRR